MKTLDQTQFHELAGLTRPIHLAIGMFDGVHLGHRTVISSATSAAQLDGGLSAVLTFSPHPSHLFRPEDPTPQIYPLRVKEDILRDLGVDLCLTRRFDADFARLTAAEFTRWLRRILPSLASVSVGENFRFGSGRGGSPTVLLEQLHRHRVSVFSCERVHLDGDAISSTRIRSMLPETPIERTNPLFGLPYRSIATVRPGKQLGRTLGFPTLNLPFEAEILPLRGVYVVRYQKLGKTRSAPRPGVANFGLRPTVEKTTEPLLEVHSLEGEAPGYGDTVMVEWIRLLRPEKKFSGTGELRAAITADRQAALAAHGGHVS